MIYPEDISIVVPSRERAKMCTALITTMLPTATVLVADNEAEAYLAAGVPAHRLTTHPNLFGMSRIKNFLVQRCQTNVCVQISDDLECIYCMPGTIRHVTDPQFILDMLHRTAVVAQDAGCAVFGYGDYFRPEYFIPNHPFAFTRAISSMVGTIGKDVVWDERILSGGDTDCTLRELLLRRIVWIDTRFAPHWKPMFSTKGGLQHIRSKQNYEDSMRLMKDKWGECFDMASHPKRGKKRNVAGNAIKVKR